MTRILCQLLMGFALCDYLSIVSVAADAPIEIQVQSRDHGKGYSATLDLTLTNSRSFPVWFVMNSPNELLPYRGTLPPMKNLEGPYPFSTEEYNEGRGHAKVLSIFSTHVIKAIYLPANGRCHFKTFVIRSNDPPRMLDIWEVKSLKVNGATPVEDWLPYDVMTSEVAEIGGRTGSGNQKFLDENKASAPQEKVKSIVAEPIRRLIVPLPE